MSSIPDIVRTAALKYMGQTVSLASLDRMTRDMVLAFRTAGMPVVNVIVPPQDITSGTVQIISVVGRLGKVTVQGNTDNPDYYVEGLELEPGDIVRRRSGP